MFTASVEATHSSWSLFNWYVADLFESSALLLLLPRGTIVGRAILSFARRLVRQLRVVSHRAEGDDADDDRSPSCDLSRNLTSHGFRKLLGTLQTQKSFLNETPQYRFPRSAAIRRTSGNIQIGKPMAPAPGFDGSRGKAKQPKKLVVAGPQNIPCENFLKHQRL